MQPPSTFGDYVIESEVSPAPEADVDAVLAEMENAMRREAYGELTRDEALLAFMTILESSFYWQRWSVSMHMDAIEPAVDYIISTYPDDRAIERAGVRALSRARRWWRPAVGAARLLGAIINARLGQVAVRRSKTGTLIFYPMMDEAVELRNRWFDVLQFRGRLERGKHLMDSMPGAANVASRIDKDIALHPVTTTSEYSPPAHEDWYRDYCRRLADKMLDAQFEHVDANESWGSMSRAQVVAALRPISRTAWMRMLGHVRAFKMLREVRGHSIPVLHSVVEVVSLDALAKEAARAAKIPPKTARGFVESLVRRGSGERHKLASSPLLPMHGDRALLAPSAFLFSNLPLASEQAITSAHVDAGSVSRARTIRYSNRAAHALQAAGLRVANDVVLPRPDGSMLTDLDIVALSPASGDVLVLQLKWFLSPSNILDMRRADRNVAAAVEQCERADANLAITHAAIEARFKIRLPSGWTLHQAIVVEATTGAQRAPARYPVITLEWLEQAVVRNGIDISTLWSEACTLADAADFVSSCAAAFTCAHDDLKLAQRVAIFEYASEAYRPVEP